jgi:hypothetical protein
MLLRVYVSDGEITVEHLLEGFAAVYYKPANEPQLILGRRTETDNYELLARVWEAANAKARELGWILAGFLFLLIPLFLSPHPIRRLHSWQYLAASSSHIVEAYHSIKRFWTLFGRCVRA